MALRTRKDYERAFAAVKSVIDEWDALGIFGSGGPDDEWNSEVASIVAQIPRIGSPRDAAHAISRVFSSSLGDPERFQRDACEDVGKRLFDALREANVLSDR